MLLRLFEASLTVMALIGAQLAFQNPWLTALVTWIVVILIPRDVQEAEADRRSWPPEERALPVPFHMRGLTSERLTTRLHNPLLTNDRGCGSGGAFSRRATLLMDGGEVEPRLESRAEAGE